ncbi:hypothetical protein BV25DRAFT_1530427 [Artomyces pyxidatus]|uniref:Uncharacterized protein n=1 Tax=Artomyces pyxidatus TaxID=48021 RepID=A0ACB8TD01_9AGAM|nr:hypothetical protein BV25DRAFT_1530427 [Artomyces pyxidatus]
MSRPIAYPNNLSTHFFAELAAKAREERGPTDTTLSIKHWLRFAERSRRAGRRCVEDGHLERAFIEHTKAAMAVLEVLPAHKDYQLLLNAKQRHNLSLNGQEILDAISELKQSMLHTREYGNSSGLGPAIPSPTIPTTRRGGDSSREVFDGAQVRIGTKPITKKELLELSQPHLNPTSGKRLCSWRRQLSHGLRVESLVSE